MIVATPGRLLDVIKADQLNIDYLKVLVMDEADEMLANHLIEDVKKIIQEVPSDT